jgi:nucleoside-diphosphate kinase
MGATNPIEASPGTIRGDFGMEIGRNLVHGSDSLENAAAEVSLFFDPDELVQWVRDSDDWIRE